MRIKRPFLVFKLAPSPFFFLFFFNWDFLTNSNSLGAYLQGCARYHYKKCMFSIFKKWECNLYFYLTSSLILLCTLCSRILKMHSSKVFTDKSEWEIFETLSFFFNYYAFLFLLKNTPSLFQIFFFFSSPFFFLRWIAI